MSQLQKLQLSAVADNARDVDAESGMQVAQ